MKKIIFVALLLITKIANSQEFPSQLWHNGMVVLANKDTIVGKIKYNLGQELIQVESNKLYVYGGKLVLYFKIFDETVNAYREFYTLPYAQVNHYPILTFFEVLLEGKITLLCREKIITKTLNDNNININTHLPITTHTENILSYTYYFLNHKGKITKYTMKKRHLLKILSQKPHKVEEFIKTNKLKINKRHDLLKIISFYNSII